MVDNNNQAPSISSIVFARLSIGFIVLICAELFSGASLKLGFWHPWTLIVTYWLYFAHFFFFTTLAVWTRRTSWPSLYLWGTLYGLYESWITKVVWYGYGGDGKLVMGSIGPFGFSEISMVFFFHPVVSFILPLAVTCLLCPSLRDTFPDLAWLTGSSKLARWTRVLLCVSFAPIMGMNSGGPFNLVLNTVFVASCTLVGLRLGRAAFHSDNGSPLVVVSRWGFFVLVSYLGVLYGVTYFGLRPEGLPSVSVQLLTLVIYVVISLGLWRHRRRPLSSTNHPAVTADELKRVRNWFALLFVSALALSFLTGTPIVFAPIPVIFVVWTLGGFALTAVVFVLGRRTSGSSGHESSS